MKTINKFLFVASLALFPLLTKAVDVQSTSTPVFVNWTDPFDQYFSVNLSLADSGGLFTGNSTFNLLLYADGGVAQLGFVQVQNNLKIKITDTQYLRGGSKINASSNFGDGGLDFFSGASFLSDAIGGLNNYIGIEFLDNNSDAHYGWIQLDLNSFSYGNLAAGFVTGYVNDAPNTGAIAGGGAVPEPSALALLAAAGAGLALIARSRRK